MMIGGTLLILSHGIEGQGQGQLLLLRTPGPVPFGTWIFSNVENIFS